MISVDALTRFYLLPVLCVFDISAAATAERNCGIQIEDDLSRNDFGVTLTLKEQMETTPANVVIGKYTTVNIETVSCSSSYINVQLFNNTIIFKTTLNFRHYVDQYHNTTLEVPIALECMEGMAYNVTVFIPLIDENTNPPTFSKNTYIIEIQLPWPAKLPINFDQEIIIRDRDISGSNAEVYVTTSHRFIRAEVEKFSIPSKDNNEILVNDALNEHAFKVKLYLQSEFEGGEYMVLLTSSDDVFVEYATLVLHLQKSDLLVQAEKFCKLIKSPIT